MSGQVSESISIVNRQAKPELSTVGHLCVELSNFFSAIQIRALNKVVDSPNSNTFHVSINKQHVLDFVIADQVKREAKHVVEWL